MLLKQIDALNLAKSFADVRYYIIINCREKQKKKFYESAIPCEPSEEKWDSTNVKQCISRQNIAEDKSREIPTQLTIVYSCWCTILHENAPVCLLYDWNEYTCAVIRQLPIRVVCLRAVVHFHIPTCPFWAPPGTSFGCGALHSPK